MLLINSLIVIWNSPQMTGVSLTQQRKSGAIFILSTLLDSNRVDFLAWVNQSQPVNVLLYHTNFGWVCSDVAAALQSI